MKGSNGNRNYGIDFLRIITMFLIIILHELLKGGISASTESNYAKHVIVQLLISFCICSVDCFGLISGYVGVNARYKNSNLIVLWLRVAYYSVMITFLFRLFVPSSSVGGLITLKSFFPVMTKSYWYFTAYFCLFLLMPIINRGVNALDKKQYSAVCIGLFMSFSILQAVFGENLETYCSYSALWLGILYIMGGYIKKTKFLETMSSKMALLLFLAVVLVHLFLLTICRFITSAAGKSSFIGSNVAILYERFQWYTFPTVCIEALFLFTAFRNLSFSNPKLIKIIKTLSPLSFSVYLIHVHPLVLRHLFANSFSQFAELTTVSMVFAIMGSAMILYMLCSIIDIPREWIFNKLELSTRLHNLETKLLGDLWNSD